MLAQVRKSSSLTSMSLARACLTGDESKLAKANVSPAKTPARLPMVMKIILHHFANRGYEYWQPTESQAESACRALPQLCRLLSP
jgi:hypothetical protein